MQKQQYTLFLTRDDGDTKSIRFCATTLRLLIFLCVAVPVIAILVTYGLLQSCQNTTILMHKNELLSQETQVYQRELQKYATIQQLVTRYEKEATPILVASKAVPASVPYDIEEDAKVENTMVEDATPENTVSANSDVTAVVAITAADNEADAATTDTPETVVQAQPDTPQADTKSTAQNEAKDVNTEKTPDKTSDKISDNNTDAERILALQTKPQGANQDSFTTVTDNKAKLTGVTISESKDTVRTSFQLGNTTDTPIAGHIYIAVQGHDKKLHPIRISEKFTAFRIIRYRDYTLEFALPKDFNAADVDKIVITAKTRDGEVFYCNGFALE